MAGRPGRSQPQPAPSAPKGKRGPARKPATPTVLGRVLARPGVIVAGASFAAVMTGIVANALILQKGHHPSPLFSPAPSEIVQPAAVPVPPPAPRQTLAEPVAPVEAPAPSPAIAEEPEAPPPAVAKPVPAVHPAKKPAPHAAAVHQTAAHKDAVAHKPAPRKDPIAQLLGKAQ